MINFIEHSSTSYTGRTRENVGNSDITLVFACDFFTLGEVLTKNCCLEFRKPYIYLQIGKITSIDIDNIVENLNAIKGSILETAKSQVRINIAGNGIYTLAKYNISQIMCDRIVYLFMEKVKNHSALEVDIVQIRSGGQTGIDEAGAKAGEGIGVETIVLSPKNWKFRDINGVDVCSEEKFKSRFKC